jgi:hypothetical protein
LLRGDAVRTRIPRSSSSTIPPGSSKEFTIPHPTTCSQVSYATSTALHELIGASKEALERENRREE